MSVAPILTHVCGPLGADKIIRCTRCGVALQDHHRPQDFGLPADAPFDDFGKHLVAPPPLGDTYKPGALITKGQYFSAIDVHLGAEPTCAAPGVLSLTSTRCEYVAECLRGLGWREAYSGHSGGGIFCVYVPDARYAAGEEWIFGMAGDTWAGNRLDENGYVCEGDADIYTDIDADTEDAAALQMLAYQLHTALRAKVSR